MSAKTCSQDIPEFQRLIKERYPDLSKRLQQLARFFLNNPEKSALYTVAELSTEASVPPSTVIRFANALDYKGFSDMRRDIRAQLHYTGSYAERVRTSADDDEASLLLSRVVESNRVALDQLKQTISEQDLSRTSHLIHQADTVYVMGVRRAQPVATYLAYGLWQLDKRCVLLGGKGGMHQEEASGIRRTDLVFLVSYFPYGEEILWMLEHAKMRSCQLITLTDSELSPLGKKADLCLYTRDADLGGIRGLSSSMSLVQSIILSLADLQS